MKMILSLDSSMQALFVMMVHIWILLQDKKQLKQMDASIKFKDLSVRYLKLFSKINFQLKNSIAMMLSSL